MADSNVNNITVFASTDYRGANRVFGIKRDDRRRHMYIIGKTGMGKSVLIENMVYSDIIAGNGVCFIDPHGDSVELILKSIPSNRINDVVYMNPADLDFPVAMNVLEKVDSRYRHLVASGIVGVFKKLWADSWGPRLEYLLRNAILALLDYPDSTLLGVNKMLIDKDYRAKVIEKIKDPVVKAFWVDEYSKYTQAFMVEAISPIQNKVGQFLSTALIRNVVGQVKSTIDMRKIMDEGKILLVNLSKGRIGEDASSMLGAMIITKIQLAAMSRVDTPEKERNDFYLYVDEFQNFATESFANILSEARKYRLNLIVGHQYVEQLDEKVASAIFGNVGTFVVFRVGATDAAVLVKEFEPYFLEEDLVNITKWHVYLKLMIDGMASDPFSAATLPPQAKPSGNEEKVIAASRERYGRSRESVEDKIARWAGVETEDMILRAKEELENKGWQKVVDKEVDFLASFNGEWHKEEEPAPAPTVAVTKPSDDGPAAYTKKTYLSTATVDSDAPTEQYEVQCNACGKKTMINFPPDGVRPVYCKECLKEYRRQQSKQEDRIKYQAELAARGETPKIHSALLANATPDMPDPTKATIRIVKDETPVAPVTTAPITPPTFPPRPANTISPRTTTSVPVSRPIQNTTPARTNNYPSRPPARPAIVPPPIRQTAPVAAPPVAPISLKQAFSQGVRSVDGKHVQAVEDDVVKNYQAIVNGEEIVEEENDDL